MKIIAEIGCNHCGNIDTALNMIEVLANYCGVDIVKFQKRNNRELLGADYDKPHPNPENSYAETYGLHRDALEFSQEQHAILKKHCEKHNVIYSCSVWDMTSAKEIIELNPAMIKIPSAKNNDYILLNYVFENYNGEVHISTGMTSNDEAYNIWKYLSNKMDRVVLYHCVSDYPVKVGNTYIKELMRFKVKFPGLLKIGFSGHHEGYDIDSLALAYDCNYLERHFTLNKNWKGTDHTASLEPDEMRALVKIVKDCQAALKIKPKDVLDCEVEQRQKLKGIK